MTKHMSKHTLHLLSGKQGVQQPILLRWPGDCARFLEGTSGAQTVLKKMTRFIAYSFGAQREAVLPQLARTLQYVRPFAHASSEGHWTGLLATFLNHLCLNHCKRIAQVLEHKPRHMPGRKSTLMSKRV